MGRGQSSSCIFDICMNLMRVCTRELYLQIPIVCTHNKYTEKSIFKRKFDEHRKKLHINSPMRSQRNKKVLTNYNKEKKIENNGVFYVDQ